jgi:hypothetical protein
LVTSVEQGKAQEAIEMKSHASSFMHQDHFLVLNKCLEQEMSQWNPTDEKLIALRTSLDSREKDLKKSLKQSFPIVIEFPEVMSLEPIEHVINLTTKWKTYAL